jgi:hypothetical protein
MSEAYALEQPAAAAISTSLTCRSLGSSSRPKYSGSLLSRHLDRFRRFFARSRHRPEQYRAPWRETNPSQCYQTYTGPGASAEWIVEAPVVNGSYTILAPYTPDVTFSDLGFVGTDTTQIELVMVQDQVPDENYAAFSKLTLNPSASIRRASRVASITGSWRRSK